MANELILIVEDNEKNRKLVRDVLQHTGYKTLEAETGEEGVRLLPVEAHQREGVPRRGPRDAGPPPRGRRRVSAPKILVVDDTPQNVKLLADLLTVKGYTVVTAASGPEALKQLDTERPDLVLLDVVMPGMSGYEACRKIRGNPATQTLPVGGG